MSSTEHPLPTTGHDTDPHTDPPILPRAEAGVIPDETLPEVPWDDRNMWEKMKNRDKELDDFHPFGDLFDGAWKNKKKRSAPVQRADKAQLPGSMGGHRGPLGTWRGACPRNHFHALEGHRSDTGAVTTASILGIISSVGLLVTLATVLMVWGLKRRSARKAKKAAEERTDEADPESALCGRK